MNIKLIGFTLLMSTLLAGCLDSNTDGSANTQQPASSAPNDGDHLHAIFGAQAPPNEYVLSGTTSAYADAYAGAAYPFQVIQACVDDDKNGSQVDISYCQANSLIAQTQVPNPASFCQASIYYSFTQPGNTWVVIPIDQWSPSVTGYAKNALFPGASIVNSFNSNLNVFNYIVYGAWGVTVETQPSPGLNLPLPVINDNLTENDLISLMTDPSSQYSGLFSSALGDIQNPDDHSQNSQNLLTAASQYLGLSSIQQFSPITGSFQKFAINVEAQSPNTYQSDFQYLNIEAWPIGQSPIPLGQTYNSDPCVGPASNPYSNPGCAGDTQQTYDGLSGVVMVMAECDYELIQWTDSNGVVHKAAAMLIQQ